MTNQVQAQYLFRYRNFHINKSQPLGHGSYGAVYKAKCDQLPCAAKVLHPTILDPRDPGAGKIMQRFQQEIAFLERIRHPHIVQYLGVTRDPESRLPVLLMELLDESLTKMLERSRQSLNYYVQVDICHDVALAVAYLHSNDIIHRDLSSNNILIIAGRRAKVTDFGMSKLAGAAPTTTPLTTCPGTLAYMPPEALREPPRYTKKMDCFSEGVIMIQVCTRLWPEPGPRTKFVQDSRSPTGSTEMPVLETVRRKNHIDQIDSKNGLLPIAINCLEYRENWRPSSEELCQRLFNLKDSEEYRDSVGQQVKAKDSWVIQQLEEKDRILQKKQDEIQEKDQVIQKQKSQFQREIALREGQTLQLYKKLKEQKQFTAEIQTINDSLQKQVEQLQSKQKQRYPKPLRPPPPIPTTVQLVRKKEGTRPLQTDTRPQTHPKPHPPTPQKVTLKWRDGGKSPFAMKRGAAAVNVNVVYFVGYDGAVCSYNTAICKWSELPKCPYQGSGIALIDGHVTTIGGNVPGFLADPQNKLLSLLNADGSKEWVEHFPPMPTKRCKTAVATTNQHVIVAGGESTFLHCLDTVEVMDIRTLTWTAVASLPHPYSWASVTLCGGHLYLLGGRDKQQKTKSVLKCSLTDLLQSSSSSSSAWHRVADAPAYYSTCAAVDGELLVVGGCGQEDDRKATAIHKYNAVNNSWSYIGDMTIPRHSCLAAVLTTNKMIVVGGLADTLTQFMTTATDKVEIVEF